MGKIFYVKCLVQKNNYFFNENYKYIYFDFSVGIATVIVCIIGILANILTLVVLKRLRKQSRFYELLIALTINDMIYLFFWGMNEANRVVIFDKI